MSVTAPLGREREIQAFVSGLMSIEERGFVTVLVGDPGIGKSALLLAARSAALDAGFAVLRASGLESEMHLPFGGVQQIVTPLLGLLESVPSRQRAALRTALGLAEGPTPDLFLIAEATLSLLVAERRVRPVAVILDDIQWLDPQSHQIFAFIAHRSVAGRLFIMAATRNGHPGPIADAGFDQMLVEGVDDYTADVLLRQSPVVLTERQIKRIRLESDGNPLALLELPSAWGAGPATDDHPLALSTRLEAAFAGRVSDLPPATQDALLIAAVGSSTDTAEILAALELFGGDRTDVRVFDAAVTAGLVFEVAATVTFRHPLVRSGVLQREPLARRHAAHHSLAEVLAGDSYRSSWHRAWSLVGPDDAVADELAETATDALKRGAVMAAVSSLERSAQLTSNPLRGGERLMLAAAHAFGAGRADIVGRILRDSGCIDLTDIERARMTWLSEALNPDVTANSSSIRRLTDAAGVACAHDEVGLALSLLMAAALRIWWADSGADDRARVTAALDRIAATQNDPIHLAALAIVEPVMRGSDVTARLNAIDFDEIVDADALRMYGMAAYGIGDLVLATDLLDRAEQTFREHGRLGLLPVVLGLQEQIRIHLGDWTGAAAASDEVNSLSLETGQAVFAENNVLVGARGIALRGEWERALQLMAQAETDATVCGINDRICLAYQARGAALLAAGRGEDAFECLKRQYDPADPGYQLRESFGGVALMAEAAADCGRGDEARAIVAGLETLLLVTPSPLLEVNLLFARAVLAAEKDQEDLYVTALEHDLARWPWVHALLQLEFGRWLAARGRRSEADPYLLAARAVFERFGAPHWLERCSEAMELRATSQTTVGSDGRLIGRSNELSLLRSRIDRLPAEGSTVVIQGPPGVGKSSVISAAIEMARTSGVVVVETSGIEAETMAPFAGLKRLLEPLLSNSASLPELQRRALATALEETAGPPPDVFLIALATLTLIVDFSCSQPVMVVADDVQWIDVGTVQVLAFVSRRLRDDSVMLVFGLRAGHEVALSDIDADVLTLDGLDDAASRELLALIARDLDPPDRAAILAQAEGNPLALVELPKSWRSVRVDSVTPFNGVVPLSTRLERAFASRLLELPQSARDALLISAVDAEGSLAETLSGYTALSGTAVTAEILEPATRADLIRIDRGAIRFRHPLVRSALIGLVATVRRRDAHAALSRVLPPGSYRQVWHRAFSVEAPNDEVADELDASHIDSIRRGSVIAAVAALERAAELTGDSRRSGKRLLLAAQHAYSLGRSDLVGRLVTAAETRDLSDLDLGRAEWLREIFSDGELGDSGRVIKLCRLAAASHDAGDPDLSFDLLLSAALRCWWAATEPVVQELVVTVAENLTEHLDDPRSIAAIAVVSPVQKGAQTGRRLVAIDARTISDPNKLFRLGMAARAYGDEPMATDYFDAAERILRERGQLGLLSQVLAIHSAVHMDLGFWRSSAECLDEARQLADDTNQPNWLTSTIPLRAVHAALNDDSDTALRLADEAEAISQGRVLRDFLSLARLARGIAHLTAGRPDVALSELEPLFDPADHRHHPREQFSGVMFLAEAAAGCGQRERGRLVIGRMEALATITPSPVLAVHLLYARAVLADDEAAETLWDHALRQDLTRWPWPRARLELAYGNWLRRMRRPIESREPLRSALVAFESIGAHGWARQARASMRASGNVDVPVDRGEDPVLTVQELQIAALAAGGLSNRQIGEQLYISARTVGSHLYRIYPKLGVTSRLQLSARLRTP